MNAIYFYMYLTVVILSTFTFTFLRCIHGLTYFDEFFYPNPNNDIFSNKIYLSSHIAINFVIGYLFGFEVILGMLVKIAIFEVYLYFTEYCDVFKTAKLANLIIIVILSVLSYTAGALTKLTLA